MKNFHQFQLNMFRDANCETICLHSDEFPSAVALVDMASAGSGREKYCTNSLMDFELILIAGKY